MPHLLGTALTPWFNKHTDGILLVERNVGIIRNAKKSAVVRARSEPMHMTAASAFGLGNDVRLHSFYMLVAQCSLDPATAVQMRL